MEDIMNACRCVQTVTVRADDLSYRVFRVLPVQSLARARRSYVLQVQPDLISYSELGGLLTRPICHFFLFLLGHGHCGLSPFSRFHQLSYDKVRLLDRSSGLSYAFQRLFQLERLNVVAVSEEKGAYSS